MKLLQKNEVDALKAQEKKLEIDEGAKLAKAVDKLRELKSSEEKNLSEFRNKTLQQVRKDIEEEVQKLTLIKDEVIALQIRRQELVKPLTEEWNKVNVERETIELERSNLLKDKEFVAGEYKDLNYGKEKLKLEEARIEKEREESKKEFKKAQEAYITSQENLAQSSAELEKSSKISQERKNSLDLREEQIAAKERDITNWSELLKNKEKYLLTEEKRINDKYLTLQRTIEHYGAIHPADDKL